MKKRAPETGDFDGLLAAVVAAVNARGMCAAEAARIARLPDGDEREVAASCRCAECARLRLN